jgi:hypothetical protein
LSVLKSFLSDLFVSFWSNIPIWYATLLFSLSSEQNPVQVEFLDANECSDFLRHFKLLLPHLNHMSVEVLYTSRGALNKEVISFQHNTLQKASHKSSRQHADFLARPKSLSTKCETGFTSGTLPGLEIPAQGGRALGVSLPRNEIVRVDLAVRPDIAVVHKQPAGKASHGQRHANDIKDSAYRAGLLELPVTAPATSSQKMWTTDEVSRLESLPRSASLALPAANSSPPSRETSRQLL